MKFLCDCSGECEDCYTHYSGGCLAGHGDDDFYRITPKRAIELINIKRGYNAKDLQKVIDELVEKFPEIKDKI